MIIDKVFVHPDYIPTRTKDNDGSLFDMKNNSFINISEILWHIINNIYYNKSLSKNNLKEIEKEFSIHIEHVYIKEIIRDLINKNIIINESDFYKISQKSAGGMYNSKMIKLSEALSHKDHKYVFFGFPYELGISNAGGTKYGPNTIREYSSGVYDYSQYSKDNRESNYQFTALPEYDVKNIKLIDCGNINGSYPEKNGKEFDYLSNVLSVTLEKKMTPIVLGGDHSIFYAEVKALLNNYKKIGIIQFDAHTDYVGSQDIKEWRQLLNHGNFWSFCIEENSIENVYQFGIRDLSKKYSNNKIHSYTVEKSLNEYREIIKNMDKNIPYYITFDVDCLDTSLLTSTGTPLPGGFTYREINKFMDILTKELNIIGMDIVEFGKGTLSEGVLISQIILDFILMNERVEE